MPAAAPGRDRRAAGGGGQSPTDLLGIAEKPRLQHTVSTGINVLRGSTLGHLPAGRVDMPDFLMGLVGAGHRVRCVVSDALWMDLGRPEDLIRANELVNGGEI